MKAFKRIQLAAFLFAAGLIISCSDSDNGANPSNSESDFLPGGVGTYWLYYDYEVDVDGSVADEPRLDSTVAGETEEKDGESGRYYDTYLKNSEKDQYKKASEMLFYGDGEKIYVHTDFIKQSMERMPIDIDAEVESGWVKYIDSGDELWRIYLLEMESMEMPMFGGGKLEDLSFEMLGSFKGEESINLYGEDFNCYKFEINSVFSANFVVKLMGQEMKYPIDLENIQTLWYAKGVGLVKSEVEPVLFEVPVVGYEIPIEGSVKKLYKYEINETRSSK